MYRKRKKDDESSRERIMGTKHILLSNFLHVQLIYIIEFYSVDVYSSIRLLSVIFLYLGWNERHATAAGRADISQHLAREETEKIRLWAGHGEYLDHFLPSTNQRGFFSLLWVHKNVKFARFFLRSPVNWICPVLVDDFQPCCGDPLPLIFCFENCIINWRDTKLRVASIPVLIGSLLTSIPGFRPPPKKKK